MSDREQAGFRGPVKICVEESICADWPVVRTATEYRRDGKLLETRSDHGNGFAWVSAREYDSAGRLTKIKPANSHYPNSEIIYVYDDTGRSLSITNRANGDRTDFSTMRPAAKLESNGSIQRLLNAHEIVRTHVPLGTQPQAGPAFPSVARSRQSMMAMIGLSRCRLAMSAVKS